MVIIAFVFINIVVKHKDIDLGNAKHLTGSAKYTQFGKTLDVSFDEQALSLREVHDNKTLFTFELTRHGARAPLTSRINNVSVIEGFSVTEGMLTPQGMR